ncbi:hypothetical protein LCGC14_0163490 [marine sediment metagenome]|uniref:Uncharacterized protein n=1 Tax=marine sediment metagenome TaxID=412755 RepID=A0A0F9UUE2_9ZZZZ
MANASIMPEVGPPSHREIKIKRVENGFTVDIKVLKKTRGFDEKIRKEATTERFVFNTTLEVIDFAKRYLEADAVDLDRDA